MCEPSDIYVTELHTTTYTPMYSLSHSIPCSISDRRDRTGVPVPPPRKSVPTIRRFLGCRSMLNLLVCLVVESIDFSVPDRHVLWNRLEDDILV